MGNILQNEFNDRISVNPNLRLRCAFAFGFIHRLASHLFAVILIAH